MFNRNGKFCFVTACWALAVVFLGTIFIADLMRVKVTVASELGLPEPTALLGLTNKSYEPILKGVSFDPDNPMMISFIIDKGSKDKVNKEEINNFVEYFLAGLTLPDSEFWVNLSPYENDRIISDALQGTKVAHQLLSQDYVLKVLSSSLTHPKTPTGSEYWKIMTAGAENSLSFDKVWISSAKASVYELKTKNTVLINESSLIAQTETDYIAQKDSHDSQAMSAILADLTKEVNTGKHFAQLRQVYNALILSKWVKNNILEILNDNVSFIHGYTNSSKTKGIDLSDPKIKNQVYSLYLESIKNGSYNFIDKVKENDIASTRKYFSGGLEPMPKSISSAIISGDQMDDLTEYFQHIDVEFESIVSDHSYDRSSLVTYDQDISAVDNLSEASKTSEILKENGFMREWYSNRNKALAENIRSTRKEYWAKLLDIPMLRQWLLADLSTVVKRMINSDNQDEMSKHKQKLITKYKELNKLLKTDSDSFKKFILENKLELMLERVTNKKIKKIYSTIKKNEEFKDKEKQALFNKAVSDFGGDHGEVSKVISSIEELQRIRYSKNLRKPINEFLLKNEKLVEFLIKKLLPSHNLIEEDEYRSLFYVAALDAVESWDPNGSKFAHHLVQTVIGQYWIYVQKDSSVRLPMNKITQAKQLLEVYEQYNQGTIERSVWEQLCFKLKITEDDALSLISFYLDNFEEWRDSNQDQYPNRQLDESFESTDALATKNDTNKKLLLAVRKLKDQDQRDIFEAFINLNKSENDITINEATRRLGLPIHRGILALRRVARLAWYQKDRASGMILQLIYPDRYVEKFNKVKNKDLNLQVDLNDDRSIIADSVAEPYENLIVEETIPQFDETISIEKESKDDDLLEQQSARDYKYPNSRLLGGIKFKNPLDGLNLENPFDAIPGPASSAVGMINSKNLGGIDLALPSIKSDSRSTISLKQFVSGYHTDGVKYRVVSINQ